MPNHYVNKHNNALNDDDHEVIPEINFDDDDEDQPPSLSHNGQPA